MTDTKHDRTNEHFHLRLPKQSKYPDALRLQTDVKRRYLHFDMWSSSHTSTSSERENFTFKKVCKLQLFKSICEAILCFLLIVLYVLNQFSIYFSCLAECCDAVLLWSSRNVLWTTKHQLTFHQHEGEEVMAEVKFLGELFLYVHVAHDTWNMGDFSGICSYSPTNNQEILWRQNKQFSLQWAILQVIKYISPKQWLVLLFVVMEAINP